MLEPELVEAIKNLVEYSWDDELDDFREQYNENGTTDGHIFLSILKLRNWLEEKNDTPESFLPPDDESED